MDPYTTPKTEPGTRATTPSAVSIIVGAGGIIFTVLNAVAVVRTLMSGYSLTRVVTRNLTNPAQLSAVIGETLIAVICRGLLAIIPATLLYLALGPLRLRRRWFHTCALICALYFLLLMPFGTIYGVVLLVALRRRRTGFTAH